MSELPPGWEWTTVEETSNVVGGVQKSPRRKPAANAVPMLRVANVLDGRLDLADVHEIELFEGELERLALTPGDCLVVEGNGSISQVGRAATWRGEITPCVHQNHVIRARPLINAQYLGHWMRSPAARQQIERVASSTSGLHVLSGRKLRRLTLPLPPLAEQERIVAAIEEHLSRLDAASTGLAAVPDKLDRFRQVLLRDSFDASWERVPITAVTDPERIIRYGILKPGDDVAGGVPVVKVRDYPAGEIRVDSLKRTTPEIAARFAGATLRPGDVLISIRGTFGRVAPVPDSLDGANITQDSARIAPLPALHRGFLVHFLRSPECQHFLRRVARGVAVKGVNIRDLRMLNIPVPDIETQVATSDRLDDQLSLHRHLGAEVDRARRGSESLRRSILSAAFSGQLVPQNPDDEPASVLLERIRAERATATPTKRTRRAKAS